MEMCINYKRDQCLWRKYFSGHGRKKNLIRSKFNFFERFIIELLISCSKNITKGIFLVISHDILDNKKYFLNSDIETSWYLSWPQQLESDIKTYPEKKPLVLILISRHILHNKKNKLVFDCDIEIYPVQ